NDNLPVWLIAPALRWERHSFCSRYTARAYQPLDVIGPLLEGRSLFLSKFVPLVDAYNAGKRTRDMVQNLLDNGEIDAEPGHAARRGAAQIMQRPRADTCAELILATKPLIRLRAAQCEKVSIANPR